MVSLSAERRAEVSEPRHVHFNLADALRATAIFAVVFHHIAYMTNPAIGHHRPIIFGYLGIWGVNCFFLLSGYLLGRPYIAMLLDPTRKVPSTKLFYLRRFLRIYPLYAVAILLTIAATYAFFRTLPATYDVVLHLLMLHTLTEDTATSINGPMWTMAVDAEFYLVLPIFAAAMAFLLRGKPLAVRVRAVLATLASLFLLAIVLRFAVLYYVPASRDDFALAVVLFRNVAGFAGTFSLGMLLALIGLGYGPRLPDNPFLFRCLFVVGVVIAILQLTVRADASAAGQLSLLAVTRLSLNEAFAAISVGLIFFGLSESKLPSIAWLIRTRFIASSAALAYAVYLVHWPVIDTISYFLKRPQGLRGFIELGAVAIVPIAAISVLLHVLVERPLLQLKDRKRDVIDGRAVLPGADTSVGSPLVETSVG